MVKPQVFTSSSRSTHDLPPPHVETYSSGDTIFWEVIEDHDDRRNPESWIQGHFVDETHVHLQDATNKETEFDFQVGDWILSLISEDGEDTLDYAQVLGIRESGVGLYTTTWACVSWRKLLSNFTFDDDGHETFEAVTASTRLNPETSMVPSNHIEVIKKPSILSSYKNDRSGETVVTDRNFDRERRKIRLMDTLWIAKTAEKTRASLKNGQVFQQKAPRSLPPAKMTDISSSPRYRAQAVVDYEDEEEIPESVAVAEDSDVDELGDIPSRGVEATRKNKAPRERDKGFERHESPLLGDETSGNEDDFDTFHPPTPDRPTSQGFRSTLRPDFKAKEGFLVESTDKKHLAGPDSVEDGYEKRQTSRRRKMRSANIRPIASSSRKGAKRKIVEEEYNDLEIEGELEEGGIEDSGGKSSRRKTGVATPSKNKRRHR
ncbi:Hypothetical protein D9617_20g028770 [Elsinoe fawcettii]|nr:Hypothetical protein D9617_20g028770 [Elsinoe fawcettii]